MNHKLAIVARWMLLGCLVASACAAQESELDPRNGLSEMTQARVHRVVPDEGQLRLASLPGPAVDGGLPDYGNGLFDSATARRLAQPLPRRTGKGSAAERVYLSTNLQPHRHLATAISDSITPARVGKNTRGALRGSLHPAGLAVDVAFPIAYEATREVVQEGRISPSKLRKSFNPTGYAGALIGGVTGDVAGAAVQSVLASSLGPAGVVAGFVARPVMEWAGASVGSTYARRAEKGQYSLTDAALETVRSVEPGRDLGAVVGGSVGTVVGQALIPIPIVGGMIGNVGGTMVGAWLGSGLTANRDRAAMQKGVKFLVKNVARSTFGRGNRPGVASDPDLDLSPVSAAVAQ